MTFIAMVIFKSYCDSFLCFLILSTVSAEQKTDPQIPTVRLKNGPTIIGETRKTFDQEKIYYSFRGIPFAKPPVGQLRFRPPVPLSDDFSNQTITAMNDGPSCIYVSVFTTGSEDCLYLNVYTPQFPGNNASLLPVMVWVYGGAFVNGDGSYATFGPDMFLNEQNVIIVTFNYRMGIFGFLSTGDEAAPGNYGLKDQVLALKWVQQNIQNFGGNPEQVTIFGESSGAVSISYLTQTPLARGLFHRVILESGTSLNPWALTRSTYSEALIIAEYFGIDTTTTQSLVDGLRKVDCNELHLLESLAFASRVIYSSKYGLPFGPTIEPPYPDAIVVNKSHEQLKNGLFHQVPYIIGFNSLEAKTVIERVSLPLPILDINAGVLIIEGVLNFFPKTSIAASLNVSQNDEFKVGVAIASYYKHFINTHLYKICNTHDFHEHGQAIAAVGKYVACVLPIIMPFLSEDQFNRPILEAARLYAQKAPVYLYRFSYEGSLPSKNIPISGVGHADELLYMWRWRKSYHQKNLTSSDLLTRERLIKLWTNFARTGNPTPDHDPLLQNIKWEPVYENGNLTYLDIGQNLSAGVNYDRDQFKFWNKLFNDYGNPPYSTY